MQLATLDTIVLILILFSFWGGWRKGVFRVLAAPAAFVISIFAGMIYWDMTENLFVSFLILSLGSVTLSIIFKILFFLGRMTIEKEYRDQVFWPSRILGGITNVVWRGFLISAFLLFIPLIPFDAVGSDHLKKSIVESKSYPLAQYYVLGKIIVMKNIFSTISTLVNPAKLNQFSDSREFREYFGDDRLQALVNDPDFQDYVLEKNMTKIMTYPKLHELLCDPEFMHRLSRLCKKIYKTKAQKDTQTSSQ